MVFYGLPSQHSTSIVRVARKNVELTMAEIRSRSPIIAALETRATVKIAGAMYNLESAAVEFLPSPKP